MSRRPIRLIKLIVHLAQRCPHGISFIYQTYLYDATQDKAEKEDTIIIVHRNIPTSVLRR